MIASADGMPATMRITCSRAESSAIRRVRLVISPSRSSRSWRSSRSPRSIRTAARAKTDTVNSARSGGVTKPKASWRKTTIAAYATELTIEALQVPTDPKRNPPVMMTTVAIRYVIQPGSLENRNIAATRTVRSQANDAAEIPRCRSREVARPDARSTTSP